MAEEKFESSLEHVHKKYGHLREAKRRAAEEARQREAVRDLYEEDDNAERD